MKTSSLFLFLQLFFLVFLAYRGDSAGTADGSEAWGYVEVRPKAHMFWWYYRSPQRGSAGASWPLVLWLQGGPGASGVGIGNFQEIGPLDLDLNPRNSTWLQVADLLFVDCPVGTGYSFVEDGSVFVKTDQDAATDLTTLLKSIYNDNETHPASNLYIVAESYGGKFAVTLGLSVSDAITTGELNLTLGGVALGDSWISPEDYVSSWGPLLKDLSRLDVNELEITNSMADNIKNQIQNGNFVAAEQSWSILENTIIKYSNKVDFYNFLLDDDMDNLSLATSMQFKRPMTKRYSSYLSTMLTSGNSLSTLMNTVIRNKLGIIPPRVNWGGQSDAVFNWMSGEFMKPRIDEVDLLLSKGINVTIYNGQVDLICATKGTEAWLQKLKWDGLKSFTNLPRQPLYCDTSQTKGFYKAFKNLQFYWILGAGHFVPVDQPCIALKMLSEITNSPATYAFHH